MHKLHTRADWNFCTTCDDDVTFITPSAEEPCTCDQGADENISMILPGHNNLRQPPETGVQAGVRRRGAKVGEVSYSQTTAEL